MGLNIICYKGRVLAAASGPRHLTSALPQLGYLSCLIEILCWKILDYTGSENIGLPSTFLQTQPCKASSTVLTHVKKESSSFLEINHSKQQPLDHGIHSLRDLLIRAISLASDLFKGASLDVNYCSRKHLLVTPSARVSMITCVFQCQIQFLIIFYCNFICFSSVF